MKKTILITGSTDGIGKLAAQSLASDRHRVLIHGRSEEKVSSAIVEITEITPTADIQGYVADLSEIDSVRHLGKEVADKESSLDVLINNAGVYNSAQPRNSTGIDMRMAVNYLAPVVLTQALLSILKKGEGSGVINLSSAAQSPVSLNFLSGNEHISIGSAYAQSKLALTMWSFYFAKEEPSLSVIAVNPGSMLNTQMVQEAFCTHRLSADVGAQILHDLAVSEKFAGVTGKYFDNDKGGFGTAHTDAYDNNKIEQLITTTESTLN